MIRSLILFGPLIADGCDHQGTNCKDGCEKAKEKKKYLVHFALLPACIKAPKDKIDGTQMATNKPVSLSPLNHKTTDSKKERPAASNIVILLNRVVLLILCSNPLFGIFDIPKLFYSC